MTMPKINQQTIIDTLIAYLIVTLAPNLLNNYLFKSNPLTGVTLRVAGAGAGFIGGALLKKPNVSNISLALALADLLKPMIESVVGGGTPTNQVVSVPMGANVMALNKGGVGVADYLRLEEYTNAIGAMTNQSYDEYKEAY